MSLYFFYNLHQVTFPLPKTQPGKFSCFFLRNPSLEKGVEFCSPKQCKKKHTTEHPPKHYSPVLSGKPLTNEKNTNRSRKRK